ncbi:thioredoxin family protein [Granulicella sp. WH15]|uniref:thioredoxin family protein n=1 Tax=Granulicella sp. WH15 TaxID=2602070 RepID=UPI001366A56C|nr:thioredoxin family protein [Granulicella sp. WH15]QHN04628.1 thioredoxin family protein [Granulicella sp. WH15]
MIHTRLKLAAILFTGLLTVGTGVLPPVQAQMAPVPPPAGRKHIYSETADPKADIAAALVQARKEHKRILLDFGGDWCGDCQVLDIYFHREPNAALLNNHFVLVHVYIGQMDKNLDVGAKYGVEIQKGVPALAVIDAHGKVLYSQAQSQFRTMRSMDPGSVSAFLNQWKG